MLTTILCTVWEIGPYPYQKAQNERGINVIFFLFVHENICCGYSLEVPYQGASNEYLQHMVSWTNEKKMSDSIFWLKDVPYLE